jgi:putative tryptophan/tyrosine transport system substrate-binding protein
MNNMNSFKKITCIALSMAGFLLFPAFGGSQASARSFTIGVAIDIPNFVATLEGFKAGMAKYGYVEGQNIRYVYNGVLQNDDKSIDAEIKRLLDSDVEMLLTVGDHSSLHARQAVDGTDMPVLMCMFSRDPIGEGIVENLKYPGGNVTGIRVSDTIPKALEWLLAVAPGAKRVYLPYNPDDRMPEISMTDLDKTASQLGIHLIIDKIHSVEEAVAGIENKYKDIDAIFRIPSVTLDTRNNEISEVAIKRGIPVGAALPLDEATLVTFSPDLANSGKQAARMALQIHQGLKPADLPVETAEAFLTINLKTAEKIGLHISDGILFQAKKIIRE